MNETFDTHKTYTFKELDINKVISLTKDFINNELNGNNIDEGVFVSFGDIKKTIMLKDIEEVFSSGKYDQIHLQISQKLGIPNRSQTRLTIFIDKQPKRLSILHENDNLDSGKKLIESFVNELELIDIYDYRLIKIRSKADRSYLEEALICRNSGAFRAAVIMGWNAVMNKIYYKIDKKYKNEFTEKIKLRYQNNKNFKQKIINNLEDYQQFKDRDVLEVSKELFLGKGLATQLLHYLDMRNDCGHVRLWQPSELTVDGFFDEIFKSVF